MRNALTILIGTFLHCAICLLEAIMRAFPAVITVLCLTLAEPGQAAVIATLSFDEPTMTVAPTADIPVWLTLTLGKASDPLTTDASSNVTSPLSAQVLGDLNGNSSGVFLNAEGGCGGTLDACNPLGSPYTFSFNFGADNFVVPANLNLQPNGSLDFLIGDFAPNGGSASVGTYELSFAAVIFQYYDQDTQQVYSSDIAATTTAFSRTVVDAVPETTSWLMILLGFGLIGTCSRASRKVSNNLSIRNDVS